MCALHRRNRFGGESDRMFPSQRTVGPAKYTVVQDPDNNRGLVVRRVPPEQLRMVSFWGGYLFATEIDATGFAKTERMSRRIAPHKFSLKRFDGRRIYMKRGRGAANDFSESGGFDVGDFGGM